MALLGDYDPNAEPAQSFEPIPPGKYVAMIVDSDVTQTKNGAGDIVKLEWCITDGEYQNRRIFETIVIRHASQKAQEIGQRKLAALRLATGVNSPRDTQEFHHRPCVVSVKIRPADGQYEAANEVKGYEPAGGDDAAPVPARIAPQRPAPAASAPPPAPAAPVPTRAPWKR